MGVMGGRTHSRGMRLYQGVADREVLPRRRSLAGGRGRQRHSAAGHREAFGGEIPRNHLIISKITDHKFIEKPREFIVFYRIVHFFRIDFWGTDRPIRTGILAHSTENVLTANAGKCRSIPTGMGGIVTRRWFVPEKGSRDTSFNPRRCSRRCPWRPALRPPHRA